MVPARAITNKQPKILPQPHAVYASREREPRLCTICEALGRKHDTHNTSHCFSNCRENPNYKPGVWALRLHEANVKNIHIPQLVPIMEDGKIITPPKKEMDAVNYTMS